MPEREYYSLPPNDGIRGSFIPNFVILNTWWFFPQKISLIYNIKKLQKFPNFWLKK
jgi:hypothetical protein